MFRMAETMAGLTRLVDQKKADFFIPFVASLDEKFKLMIDACPLKSIVLDPHNKMINLVFWDELKFQTSLVEASTILQKIIGDSKSQANRHAAELDATRINNAISSLEKEAHALIS